MAPSSTSSKHSTIWLLVLVMKSLHHLLQTGLMKSLGVLIPAIVKEYNTDYAVAGAVSSVVITMTFCSQYLARQLQKRLPTKPLAVISGFLSGVCICCTVFTRNVIIVLALFFVAGLFDGVVALILVTDLHRLDKKRFPAACTFTHVVSLCGGIVMPSLTEKMYEAYGLQGTLLLLGGFMLNEIPIGMSVSSTKEETIEDIAEGCDKSGEVQRTPKTKTVDLNGLHEDRKLTGDVSNANVSEASSGEQDEEMKANKFFKHDQESIAMYQDGEFDRNQGKIHRALGSGEDGSRWPLINNRAHGKRCPKEGFERQNCRNLETCKGITTSVCRFLNFNIFLEERTFAFTILPCASIQGLVSGGWVVFCVSYGLSVGLDPDIAIILPLVGAIGGIISRLFFSGLLLIYPCWSSHLLLLSLVAGTVSLFAQVANSSMFYLMLCTFMTGFGVFSANVLIDAFVASTVADERFPDCIALMMFSVGICTVGSGCISGYIYDVTGSFKLVFIILASVEATSILIMLTFFIQHCRH